MSGTKRFKCDKCGMLKTLRKNEVCICGGNLRHFSEPIGEGNCHKCGRTFKKKRGNSKHCDKCVRKYEKDKPKEVSKYPWSHLVNVLDSHGRGTGKRRTLIHVLEDKTINGDWPYYDVLAGVGPCNLDDCPWI